MSSYITRYCEKHGDWEQDVDDPYAECSQCEAEGIAPSQRREQEWAERDGEITALREQLAEARADLARALTDRDMSTQAQAKAEAERAVQAVMELRGRVAEFEGAAREAVSAMVHHAREACYNGSSLLVAADALDRALAGKGGDDGTR